jgi:hypothetical protein
VPAGEVPPIVYRSPSDEEVLLGGWGRWDRNPHVLYTTMSPRLCAHDTHMLAVGTALNARKKAVSGDTAAAKHFAYVIDDKKREPFNLAPCWLQAGSDVLGVVHWLLMVRLRRCKRGCASERRAC